MIPSIPPKFSLIFSFLIFLVLRVPSFLCLFSFLSFSLYSLYWHTAVLASSLSRLLQATPPRRRRRSQPRRPLLRVAVIGPFERGSRGRRLSPQAQNDTPPVKSEGEAERARVNEHPKNNSSFTKMYDNVLTRLKKDDIDFSLVFLSKALILPSSLEKKKAVSCYRSAHEIGSPG